MAYALCEGELILDWTRIHHGDLEISSEIASIKMKLQLRDSKRDSSGIHVILVDSELVEAAQPVIGRKYFLVVAVLTTFTTAENASMPLVDCLRPSMPRVRKPGCIVRPHNGANSSQSCDKTQHYPP